MAVNRIGESGIRKVVFNDDTDNRRCGPEVLEILKFAFRLTALGAVTIREPQITLKLKIMENFGITVVGINNTTFFIPCDSAAEAENLKSYYYKLGATFIYNTWN